MSDSTTSTPTATPTATAAPTTSVSTTTTGPTRTDVAVPSTPSEGRTSIADTVVSKIAGIAAREIDGVHALGGGAARAVGALRERIPGSRTNLTQGVAVEVGERQAAVDLDIVAEYGVAITDLATAIRRNVVGSVERMTGLEVTEVNITVHDVFMDDGSDDPDGAQNPPRVQ
ncbi:Alkaline shock protein 23 [Nocardioides aquaticus]|uniref:Alkaline shock protein 23 n=1 Tax=Nocardioides aquaticus TaxID=160826 RepID=A0ABX8ELT5_9ACTN|nr:Asp23/Gls24 family envelope stress response protein [Nocardioides aquaticus]QVT81326.1 Alkaline shock protein 23 [Nocardioides aquaticus]